MTVLNNIDMKTINVFVNEQGEHGNPVGVVLDKGKQILQKYRQKIAFESGFSEVVFIDDLAQAKISIFNPLEEHNFAGHAILGTAWEIARLTGNPVTSVVTNSGLVECWSDQDKIWLKADINRLPTWNFSQLDSIQAVETLSIEENLNKEHLLYWAWLDENKGIIRARTFANDWGIPEDEANGSGAMKLAFQLQRNIQLLHGKGSEIFTLYDNSGVISLGGKVLSN